MNRFFSFLWKTACLSLLFYAAHKFCEAQTDGFTVMRIRSDFPTSKKWHNSPIDQELSAILNQDYFYLARGGQCFAFVSADNQYVIKLFKSYFSPAQNWLLSLPLPQTFKASQQKRLGRNQKKRDRDFKSYELVFNQLKEESGLIHLHLAPTANDYPKLTIHDKLGIAHCISLDKTAFIIQKKGELAFAHLDSLMTNLEIEKAKRAIDSLMDLVIIRSQKKIFDEDAKVHRNFGFLADRAIFIDVGRFRNEPALADPTFFKADLLKTMGRLQDWLKLNYPELAEYLDEKMQRV